MAVLRPMGDDVRYWAAGSVFTSVLDFSRLLIALLNEGWVGGWVGGWTGDRPFPPV